MLLTAAALGAFHGINPAMGWLFAVALGLQDRRLSGVLRALPPIILGHAASVAAVLVALVLVQRVVPVDVLRWVVGSALVIFGGYKLLSRRTHPRWVGMRVGFRDLTLWSFLMSSAHGAGLMLAPVLLHAIPVASAGHAHAGSASAGFAALGVHTLALFVVMTGVAIAVFVLFGVELLRRAWINVDVLWAGALVTAGVVTLIAG